MEIELSVVVVEVSDTVRRRADAAHMAWCLESLMQQIDPPRMEVLIPYIPRADGRDPVAALARRFPHFTFIPVADASTEAVLPGAREHHDELRARGLAIARGAVVGFLEDHARADPGWSSRAASVRLGPWAGVGGAIENEVDRPLNWAIYFCDFYRYQNPVPEGETGAVSDANVVYRRDALEAVRLIWKTSYREPAVNAALVARGWKLALDPRLVVYQHRVDLRLGEALRERFIWGRSYAASRCGKGRRGGRVLRAAMAPALPGVLLLRMARTVLRNGRSRGAFFRALPLTAMLVTAWSAGEAAGYLTGSAGGSQDRS